MKTIHVHASKEYPVMIGSGLLSRLGQETAQRVQGRTAVIVSDDQVWNFYGNETEKTLMDVGITVYHFLIPPGENSKNGCNYLKLLNFLAEHTLTRSDCLIALGGGVVGDLCGFAAATFLRGIAYIQVPTTLLAMVDSSVGGKTAIDLPAGKNLAGAFYQPSLVLCDTGTLTTLPFDELTTGYAEVIKYAVIFDRELFSQLEQMGRPSVQEDTIARCVEWKARSVQDDEYDLGSRQMLNFGHTIGHAIERESNYQINHGQAVAIGMSLISRMSANAGLCSWDVPRRIEKLLTNFALPTTTVYRAEQLLTHILSDKKRSGEEFTLVIPATIGCCRLKTISVSQLNSFIMGGM